MEIRIKTFFKALLALTLFTTLLSLPGCSKNSSGLPSKRNMIRVNLGHEPHSLDPRKSRDLNSMTIARMVFEGMTRMGKHGKPELALAKKIDLSADLKTYTIHLKESYWSNGERLTADDFIHSFQKSLDKGFPSDQSFQLFCIKNGQKMKRGECDFSEVGVQKKGVDTLEITLENPTPYFLELLSLPVFFPVNQKTDLANKNWATTDEEYVCNGPFSIKNWRHSDHITLVKNDHYWDADKVKVNGIDLSMVSGETEFAMYENGEIDWSGSPLSVLPVDAIPKLKKEKKLKLSPMLATKFIRANTSIPALSHPSIRKALSLTIDRRAITQYVTQGDQIPATALVPKVMNLSDKPYFEDGDEAKASRYFKSGLEELGITKEQFPTLTLTYVIGERNHHTVQAIQEQWRRVLGVDVKLECLEKKVFFSRVRKADYELSLGDWYGDYNDAINFLEVFKTSETGSNNTHWGNKRYENLLCESVISRSPEKRRILLRESEQILMNEMPIFPVYHYTMSHVQNENLKGVALSPLGVIDFKYAYFQDVENNE